MRIDWGKLGQLCLAIALILGLPAIIIGMVKDGIYGLPIFTGIVTLPMILILISCLPKIAKDIFTRVPREE